jgi:ribonuclease HII
MLDPATREAIDRRTSRLPRSLVVIPSRCIDEAREVMSLNDLEVYGFASALASIASGGPLLHRAMPPGCQVEVMGRAPPCKVWMDAADVDEDRFTERIGTESASMGLPEGFLLSGRHRADATYPEVSGASIAAKVRRDFLIKVISSELGEDVGSGYPSDPVTLDFLRSYIARTGDLPAHARRSWDTARRLLDRGRNRSLLDF